MNSEKAINKSGSLYRTDKDGPKLKLISKFYKIEKENELNYC